MLSFHFSSFLCFFSFFYLITNLHIILENEGKNKTKQNKKTQKIKKERKTENSAAESALKGELVSNSDCFMTLKTKSTCICWISRHEEHNLPRKSEFHRQCLMERNAPSLLRQQATQSAMSFQKTVKLAWMCFPPCPGNVVATNGHFFRRVLGDLL